MSLKDKTNSVEDGASCTPGRIGIESAGNDEIEDPKGLLSELIIFIRPQQKYMLFSYVVFLSQDLPPASWREKTA